MTPEHLHLALNHLPMVGVLAALPVLVIGVFMKGPAVARAGLLTTLLFASTTGLVMGTGEEAEERYTSGPRLGVIDEGGEAWLHEHDERAHVAGKVGYGLIALAAAGLLLSYVKVKWTRWGALGVCVGVVVTSASMGWAAEAAGKIRRPEWRGEAPIKLPMLTDRDGDGQPDGRFGAHGEYEYSDG